MSKSKRSDKANTNASWVSTDKSRENYNQIFRSKPATEEHTSGFHFSSRSKKCLETCHPDLQLLFNEVIKHVDCTIIEGARTEELQKEYVELGASRTMNSKHLIQADGYSHAVDVIAYPIDWKNNTRNAMFVGFVRHCAISLGLDIRCGLDWDMDFETSDQTFIDMPHFELKS